MGTRKTEIPGAVVEQVDAALNNFNDSPEAVAAQREASVRAAAAIEMTKAGDLKGAERMILEAAAGIEAAKLEAAQAEAQPTVSAALLNDPDVQGVMIPAVSRERTSKFGPELRYPAGTQLNKDKKPVDGTDEAYYVVGAVKTAQGYLVGRAIPLAPAVEPELEAVA